MRFRGDKSYGALEGRLTIARLKETAMSNVTGYYNTTTPTAPTSTVSAYQTSTAAPPVVQGTSTAAQAPGQQPVFTSESWTPTSSTDPYVAGIRTSGAAVIAAKGAAQARTMSRWATMLRGRSAAGLSNSGAAIQSAKSVSQKAAYLDKAVLLKNQAKIKSAGPLAAFRGTFLSFGNIARAIGSSALVAIPMSIVTNFLDWKAGRINDQQRNTLMVADSIGYTATGASSTLIGGAIGSTFLGPGVGTVVGIAAGLGLGWVYEKFIRPRWGEMVGQAMYPAAPAPAPTPQPNFPPPVEPK